MQEDEVELPGPPEDPYAFVNTVSVGMSFHEIRITLGQQFQTDRLPAEVFRFVCSPAMAAQLAEVLGQIGAEYRKQFGPPPTPNRIVQAIPGALGKANGSR